MKRTILDYFSSQRSRPTTRSSPTYPVIDSRRHEYDFSTFHTSSNQDYSDALAEMRSGRKTSHWIWYILPQLANLGSSSQAIWYGIKSLPEATKYLNDEILGPRLVQICEVIDEKLAQGIPIKRLMGSGVDAAKLLSSVTLFYFVSYQTNHEELFTNLRVKCEKQLKRQDLKTIEFCEKSLNSLKSPIPTSHQYYQDDIETNDPLSQSSSLSSSHPSLSSSQPSSQSEPILDEISQISIKAPENDYPVLSSTRIENDFSLFYRFSPERYHQVLLELQSKETTEYSYWLWFLLPQLVFYTSQTSNSLYFGIKSLPEAKKFYQDEVLGFQLLELLGVIYERLDEENDIEKVLLSRDNSIKVLSCVTLFAFISELVDETSLPYLKKVRELEVMKRNDFTSPKTFLKFLKEFCESFLLVKDEKSVEFCCHSLRVLDGEKSSGLDENKVAVETRNREQGREEKEEIKKSDDYEQEGPEVEKKEEDEDETEQENDDQISLDSGSREYNEYIVEEEMELQISGSALDDDDGSSV